MIASGQDLNVLRARSHCQVLLELLVLTGTPAETNFLCDRNQLDHRRRSSLLNEKKTAMYSCIVDTYPHVGLKIVFLDNQKCEIP